MNVLIIKAGATGDVVRTTPLLQQLKGAVTWLTASNNTILFQDLQNEVRCLSWDERHKVADIRFDLVINLEDSLEAAAYLQNLEFSQLFGAYLEQGNALRYTDDAKYWFDLSLISSYGRQRADELKFLNRRTYQDLIFAGLGLSFKGEQYLLPRPLETSLSGDVALAVESGPVWPMKKWAYYGELKEKLEAQGLIVNVLPKRSSLLEHLADVRNHRCLVGGDSLPMHFALGTGTRCVSIFTCTSPWEIYDYGIQKKLISPLLKEFFYRREYDFRATSAIGVEDVFAAVMSQLEVEGAMHPFRRALLRH